MVRSVLHNDRGRRLREPDRDLDRTRSQKDAYRNKLLHR